MASSTHMHPAPAAAAAPTALTSGAAFSHPPAAAASAAIIAPSLSQSSLTAHAFERYRKRPLVQQLEQLQISTADGGDEVKESKADEKKGPAAVTAATAAATVDTAAAAAGPVPMDISESVSAAAPALKSTPPASTPPSAPTVAAAAVDTTAELDEDERILSDVQIDYLLSQHVKTIEDVLCISPHRWPEYAPLPRSLFQQLQSIVLSHSGKTITSGVEEKRRRVVAEAQKMPTGSESLDALLEGGLLPGSIHELVAASSCGKSTLCMQLAAVAAMRKLSVMVIDSSDTFSIERAQQYAVARASGARFTAEQQAQLEDIEIRTAFDIDQLLFTLEELRDKWQQKLTTPPHLLIMDSLGAIFAPILGAGRGRGQALMLSAMRLIQSVAVEYQIAVVTTNHTVVNIDAPVAGISSNELKAALGMYWMVFADVRLTLEQIKGRSSLRPPPSTLVDKLRLLCRLVKSNRQAVGIACELELSASGVQ